MNQDNLETIMCQVSNVGTIEGVISDEVNNTLNENEDDLGSFIQNLCDITSHGSMSSLTDKRIAMQVIDFLNGISALYVMREFRIKGLNGLSDALYMIYNKRTDHG